MQELAAIDIAARSALFATAKLGFGDVYVLEEEKGYLENVIGEMLYLIRHSSNDVLDDVTFEQTTNLETNRCHFATIEQHQLEEPEGKGQSADSIRKPRAIIIVGGDEDRQEAVMQTLWTPKVDINGKELALPKETWDTLFGGTVMRIPSLSTSQYGQQVIRKGQEMEPGVTWERGGWIHVAPWILDRDRVQKRVVEAWARRGAPIQSMQSGWI